jgi:sporulation protein YlmC with PRC-barrel domain
MGFFLTSPGAAGINKIINKEPGAEPIMPFFAGEIFVSNVHKKPVLDQTGEEIGKLKDIIIGIGEPFPAVTALVVVIGKETYLLPWDQINLFNRRVITANVRVGDLKPGQIGRASCRERV